MNDKEIDELVAKLDQALNKHGLNFQEYLLYRALHTYENSDDKVMQSLEEKGFIKDKKIVDENRIHDLNHAIGKFFNFENEEYDEIKKENLHNLTYMFLFRPPGSTW